MKRLIAGLPAMLLLLAACGSAPVAGPDVASESRTSPTATAPPPSAAGATSPETRGPSSAVLVDLTSSPTAYTISLVDTDGGVALTMTGLKRTELVTHDGTAIRLPYVSTTKASLYYLDGDSVVHGFRINSAPPADIRLDVPSGSEAAFAVSPDDSEIAVSVLDFTVKPVRVTLYTDSLAGGHKHVIFQSTSNYVWPVAWHSGLIVLAHAYGPYEESIAAAAPARDNPYSAVSYHLVDPANANRKVLMGACTVSGPLSPAGSGCIQGGSIDWQGNVSEAWSQTDWGTRSSAAALSPDGQWMAATSPDNPAAMAIYERNGNVYTYVDGPGLHDWAGWIDDKHIIVGSELAGWHPTVTDVIDGGVVHPVAARGFFAAVFPTNIA